MTRHADATWALTLYRRSVLKQQKYRTIASQLGDTRDLRCLDLGSDNGVISYLLRRRGGSWSSADLDAAAVESIRALVGTEVYRIDGGRTPFENETFDRVVIVDLLEHLEDDGGFIEELFRIMRPGARLIINVPHEKRSLLRGFRLLIGQTDARHGHVRHGYTAESLHVLLGDRFTVQRVATYSKFFSEAVDTLIRWATDLAKGGRSAAGSADGVRKGTIITGHDLDNHRTLFKLYTLVYPVVWIFSRLDALLYWRSGYMLIASAEKRPAPQQAPSQRPTDPLWQLKGERVLVTGATGFTGSVLTRRLVNGGAKVVAIARPASDLRHLRDLPIEWIRGDITDGATIRQAVSGAAYVFHLATTFRQADALETVHARVHIEGTRRLAEAALKTGALKRFVHVSTIGVHGHIDEPPADEEYRFAPGDAYQRTKADAERWIRTFAEETGLPLTVVRPSVIYGPGDRRLLKIFKMVTKRWFPLVGNGRGLLHLVHVDDLAEFMAVAAVHPKAQGEVFICGGPRSITLKRMLDIIMDQYGTRVRFMRVPAAPVFWLARLCELVCAPLGVSPPLFRRRVAFFTKDRSFTTRKMTDTLSFRTRIDDETGLRQTAQWYLDHNWLTVNGGQRMTQHRVMKYDTDDI